MLSFLQKKNTVHSVLPYEQDLHSHILPGIDDGSPDVETSLLLIKGLQALGIKSAIATPHINSSRYPNTPDTIQASYILLQSAIANAGIDFKVDFAAEYFMDDVFFEQLRRKEKLLTFKGNHLLTEFSFSTPPFNIEKYAYEICMEGYSPVLAHPERFSYFHNKHEIFHRLVELGFSLQTNVLAVTGYYGPGAAKAARYLIENELVSFIGSDLHHIKGLSAMQDAANLTLMHNTYSAGKFNLDFL